ncbi:cytochrome-c peroxidase [Roseateles noduli]|uniref:cytochrome-c peroxidase n=1 Tax=Roseateles noduli TaxID=2052484 RepID=UPI003D64B6E6
MKPRTSPSVERPTSRLKAAALALLTVAACTTGGLASMLVSAGTPAPPARSAAVDPVAALGEELFFDPRLSADGRVSCASCHLPDKYFSDGLPVSKGVDGKPGARNAPSLLNALANGSQFWDGRSPTLEHQALQPFTNPNEMGLPDLDTLVRRVADDPAYRQAFARAFGTAARRDGITAPRIADAIARYERTLVAPPAPFDRHTDAAPAMSPEALRGYRLFTGYAKCASCHTVNGGNGVNRPSAPFTDDTFHTLSVGLERIAGDLAPLSLEVVRLRENGRSADDVLVELPQASPLGRFILTLKAGDIGAFRTPSLRNVAETAPYMHDGSLPTLEEAVDHEVYYRSSEQGRPMLLTPTERRELVEFLRTLSSPRDEVAALGRPVPPSVRRDHAF